MNSKYKEIEKQMVEFTFGIYTLTAVIIGFILTFLENKGQMGYWISGILFWVGFLLVRYLNKKQIISYFEKLEMSEHYAIQRQREEER